MPIRQHRPAPGGQVCLASGLRTINVVIWPLKDAPEGCSTRYVYLPNSTRVVAANGAGVGVQVGIRMAVGARAVSELSPCLAVKLVGSMVGVRIPSVWMGEGIEAALINAWAVPCTTAVIVDTVSCRRFGFGQLQLSPSP